MKQTVLLFFLLVFITASGQELSLNHLISAASLPASKINNFAQQKGFALQGIDNEKDTLTHNFLFRGKTKKAARDSTRRSLMHQTINNEMVLTYKTSSFQEFSHFTKRLKDAGFHCPNDSLMIPGKGFMYQNRDIIVKADRCCDGDLDIYSFQVQKKTLPSLKEIEFAEDLLKFGSHEQLRYVFGDQNVRKDLYYFSENEFSRCSVLFANTDRQAVFLWEDEKNDCGLVYLVLGGQLMLQSAKDYHLPVAENSWFLKSKVHAGMNLRELRRLNGSDFEFHPIHSKYSGMVLPENSGNIDFRKESVVLACMNCKDMDGKDNSTLSADEAIAEGRSFFVFTILLYPSVSNR